MRMGTVSSRVALLLRSAEVKPFSQRFVQLESVGLLSFFFVPKISLEGRSLVLCAEILTFEVARLCTSLLLCRNFDLRAGSLSYAM
jgi:hypothetical protein